MKNLSEIVLTGDVELAKKLALITTWLKIILATLVILAYFSDSTWLSEIIVISVVVSLIAPLGFFNVFIQALLEYNTTKLENRQNLNAQEANEHFEKLYKKVGK
jgi:fatty acid desaturase